MTDECLIGTNLFPSLVPLPDGTEIQLGELVRRAAGDTDPDVWNHFGQDVRDGAIVRAYLAWQAEIGKVYPLAYEIADMIHRMQRGDYSKGSALDLSLKWLEACRPFHERRDRTKGETKP